MGSAQGCLSPKPRNSDVHIETINILYELARNNPQMLTTEIRSQLLPRTDALKRLADHLQTHRARVVDAMTYNTKIMFQGSLNSEKAMSLLITEAIINKFRHEPKPLLNGKSLQKSTYQPHGLQEDSHAALSQQTVTKTQAFNISSNASSMSKKGAQGSSPINQSDSFNDSFHSDPLAHRFQNLFFQQILHLLLWEKAPQLVEPALLALRTYYQSLPMKSIRDDKFPQMRVQLLKIAEACIHDSPKFPTIKQLGQNGQYQNDQRIDSSTKRNPTIQPGILSLQCLLEQVQRLYSFDKISDTTSRLLNIWLCSQRSSLGVVASKVIKIIVSQLVSWAETQQFVVEAIKTWVETDDGVDRLKQDKNNEQNNSSKRQKLQSALAQWVKYSQIQQIPSTMFLAMLSYMALPSRLQENNKANQRKVGMNHIRQQSGQLERTQDLPPCFAGWSQMFKRTFAPTLVHSFWQGMTMRNRLAAASTLTKWVNEPKIVDIRSIARYQRHEVVSAYLMALESVTSPGEPSDERQKEQGRRYILASFQTLFSHLPVYGIVTMLNSLHELLATSCSDQASPQTISHLLSLSQCLLKHLNVNTQNPLPQLASSALLLDVTLKKDDTSSTIRFSLQPATSNILQQLTVSQSNQLIDQIIRTWSNVPQQFINGSVEAICGVVYVVYEKGNNIGEEGSASHNLAILTKDEIMGKSPTNSIPKNSAARNSNQTINSVTNYLQSILQSLHTTIPPIFCAFKAAALELAPTDGLQYVQTALQGIQTGSNKLVETGGSYSTAGNSNNVAQTTNGLSMGIKINEVRLSGSGAKKLQPLTQGQKSHRRASHTESAEVKAKSSPLYSQAYTHFSTLFQSRHYGQGTIMTAGQSGFITSNQAHNMASTISPDDDVYGSWRVTLGGGGGQADYVMNRTDGDGKGPIELGMVPKVLGQSSTEGSLRQQMAQSTKGSEMDVKDQEGLADIIEMIRG